MSVWVVWIFFVFSVLCMGGLQEGLLYQEKELQAMVKERDIYYMGESVLSIFELYQNQILFVPGLSTMSEDEIYRWMDTNLLTCYTFMIDADTVLYMVKSEDRCFVRLLHASYDWFFSFSYV